MLILRKSNIVMFRILSFEPLRGHKMSENKVRSKTNDKRCHSLHQQQKTKTMAVHDKIFLFFKIILIMIKPYDILIKYEKKSILNIIVKKLFTLQNIIYILFQT